MAELQGFLELRPVLFGIAYRMLGSSSEAEDVLQEAYIRWSGVEESTVESPRAYLTTIVTRLSIDTLRKQQSRRETYRGPWLPEPVALAEEETLGPGTDLADSLSMAFLVLLEELAPPERAAFLLREVFGYEYGAIADALGRTEPACRQMVSRARRRIGDRRKRFEADHGHSRELMRRFVLACGTGQVEDLMSLLTSDVVVWTDSGGQVKAAPRPVVGPWRAARFLVHVAKSFSPELQIREVSLNGQPGMIFVENRVVTNAVVFDILEGRISGVRVVLNPLKLSALEPDSGSRLFE
jgi:RNA polymerase sigma-70 factor, ECF subfamily